jgi:mono/diheme cytochrome c family protein
MKILPKAAILIPLLALLVAQSLQTTTAQQDTSPTPTYDPLVEPPLPPNPSEYELGRNLYWHWCMTCHGDRGQGLTDEFRGIWDPDHQNCWGRGCHSGRPGEEGFPIPTVVPALVSEAQLARFASLQELADYLEGTHPPQSPGILKSEEYHAIALFVFTMNERPPLEITPSAAPAFTPMKVPATTPDAPASSGIVLVGALLAFGALGMLILIKRLHTT